jgi:hypothetical protein
MNWEQRKTVQLGSLGERIVDEYLAAKGVIPYAPAVGGAHPFDRLCAYKKSRIFIAETKTKPRRIKYPDTGIDLRHYADYKHIEKTHSLDVWLFFVDSDSALVYGGKLKDLEAPQAVEHGGAVLEYPIKWEGANGGTIYFPLKAMKVITELLPEQVAQLRDLSGRAKEYEQAVA